MFDIYRLESQSALAVLDLSPLHTVFLHVDIYCYLHVLCPNGSGSWKAVKSQLFPPGLCNCLQTQYKTQEAKVITIATKCGQSLEITGYSFGMRKIKYLLIN